MSRRRRWGFGRVLLAAVLIVTALLLLPVLALRWLPAPTSAFMLASPVRPVQQQWVPPERIADSARRAVVAAEDQKFYQHQGFDVEAIEKAYAHNQKAKRKRGASTISQQTAKNLFLWSGGGYFRKGLEAAYTVLIEALWPKQRILTVYLNIAEFGPGIYGVEAAAQAYFKKSAAQLSASEAARLAAVLPSPRKWKVINPGAYVQKRSAWILRQMGYGARPPVQREPEPEQAPELEDAPSPLPEEPAAAPLPEPAAPATEPPSGSTQAEVEAEAEARRAAELLP